MKSDRLNNQNPMYSLPIEIRLEIVGWLKPEEQQMYRLTDKRSSELVPFVRVNFLRYGIEHDLRSYAEFGMSCNNPKGLTCKIAVECGRLEMLKWAVSRGLPWGMSVHACAIAAKSGHLEILQWVRSQGHYWNMDKICSYAAERGYLDILEWMCSQGGKCDEDDCVLAAMYGHLEILRWLHANGYPWGEDANYWAASGGYLEILQWTRDNGHPWNFQDVDVSDFPQHVQDYIAGN